MSKRLLSGCTGFLGTVLTLACLLLLTPRAEARQVSFGFGKLPAGVIGAVCGNGTVETGEECDDGNTTSNDGCSSDCHREFCGDGVLNGSEQCDDGNNAGGDGCSSDCHFEKCGDGVLDEGEQCDDGNNVGGDGCSSDCTFEKCGDGVLDEGEQCDDGNNVGGDGCSSDCTFEKCGDGVLDEGEQCDDGNSVDGDGCSSDCLIEETAAEGCTPGFWKNHTSQWVGYAPDAEIGSVFSAAAAFPTLADDSLQAGLGYQGGSGAVGGARILLRAAIAALLNEAHPDVDYSVDGVIGLVDAALTTQDRDTMIGLGGLLDDANNGADGCPLSGGNTNRRNGD